MTDENKPAGPNQPEPEPPAHTVEKGHEHDAPPEPPEPPPGAKENWREGDKSAGMSEADMADLQGLREIAADREGTLSAGPVSLDTSGQAVLDGTEPPPAPAPPPAPTIAITDATGKPLPAVTKEQPFTVTVTLPQGGKEYPPKTIEITFTAGSTTKKLTLKSTGAIKGPPTYVSEPVTMEKGRLP